MLRWLIYYYGIVHYNEYIMIQQAITVKVFGPEAEDRMEFGRHK